jgi:hypothetical protein
MTVAQMAIWMSMVESMILCLQVCILAGLLTRKHRMHLSHTLQY